MKKVFLLTLAIVMVVGFIFAGCAEEVATTTQTTPTTTTTSTTPTTPTAFEWPESLAFNTYPTTSSGYIATAAWTPILEADTGMKVKIMPQPVPATMMKVFGTGEYDMMTLVSSAYCSWIEAQGAAAKESRPYQMRVIYRIMDLQDCIWVRGDSPIESWADVKPGVSFAVDASTARGMIGAKGVAAWAGLDPEEDVVYVNASSADAAADLVLQGKADMLGTPSSVSSPYTFEAAADPHGIRLLEFDPTKDPEAAKRMAEYTPYYLYKQCWIGPEEAQGLFLTTNIYTYVVRPEFDEELVYQLTKWLDENFDSYKDRDKRIADMSIESFVECLPTSFMPVHEGVIKYLKEKGVWTDQMQSSSDKSIDLIDQYTDAFDSAIASAEAKGIVVDGTNEEWLNFWENYKKELGLRRISPWVP